jgi:hypothetical protein
MAKRKPKSELSTEERCVSLVGKRSIFYSRLDQVNPGEKGGVEEELLRSVRRNIY